jgi:hypothetical protein
LFSDKDYEDILIIAKVELKEGSSIKAQAMPYDGIKCDRC